VNAGAIPLDNDGGVHRVRVVLGFKPEASDLITLSVDCD
jgi:hypothetical protein